MKFRSKLIAGAVAAIVVFGGGTGTAMATDSMTFLTGASSAASLQDRYTDAEILEVFFNGTGPVADQNPVLVERLNFAEDRELADPVLLDRVINEYLAYNPDVGEEIITPLTSGNPAQVEAALTTLSHSYLEFLEQEYGATTNMAAKSSGGCWAGAAVCVIAYGVVFVNVALYANAAIATLAVAALAVVPAAISYLMDEESGESVLVKNELVAEMTRALATAR